MSRDKYFLRILSFSFLFLILSLVRASAAVTVSCTLPAAQVSVSYMGGSCTASGGTSPYTFSVVGSLPPGLGLSAPTATSTAISGTPTTAGATFSFSISAMDSSPTPVTGTAAETMTVSPAALTLTCNVPLAAQVGVAYTGSCTAGAGTNPYTYSVTGAAPAWFSINASTGAITGTPTAPGGTYSFTLKVTDNASQTQTQTVTNLVVSPAALTLTCNVPLAAQKGVAYVGGSCTGGGGTPPYTYSISAGALPGGIALNSSTGAITGTPSATGTFSFTVKVADNGSPAQSTTQAITNFVVAPATLTLSCAAPSQGIVGAAYSASCNGANGTPPYTYSISSGALPNGVNLNTSTGSISGTLNTAGTFTFTVKIADGGNPAQSATQSETVNVIPLLSITTTQFGNGIFGISYSAMCNATGGTPPYTFSISAGALPGGLSLDPSTCGITGTPSASGTFNFSVKVTDTTAPNQTATQPLSITINPALVITYTSAPNGVVGLAYSLALTAQNGTGPYAWSISSGSLPAGLNLNASSGLISGTPNSANTYSFTVKVTDNGSPVQTQTQTFSNVVIAAGLTITTISLPNSFVGNSGYSATLSAQNGQTPYSWSISSGSLPGGLSLSGSAITGTPNAAGTFSFTVKVTDSTAPTAQVSTQPLSITIAPALTLTCNVPLAAQMGVAYAGGSCTGGSGTPPYTYSISGGALPSGIGLNSSTGAITGTPSAAGTFSFTLKVVDNGSPAQSTTQAISNFVVAPSTLTLSCAAPSQGIVNAAYSANCNGGGGTNPYVYSISSGTLPNGVTLNTSNGSISGTLNTAGTFTFTVKVTDGGNPAQSATQIETVKVIPLLSITTTQFGNGIAGISYSATCNASGGTPPYAFSISAGALPGGLSLNPSTCGITGMPTASGTFNFSVKVTDATAPSQTATQPLSITINPALVITSTSVPNGSVGLAYVFALTAQNGTGPYAWSISSGTLPAGLNLNSSSGLISGTPNSANTYSFTVKLTDSGSPVQTQTQTFSNVLISAGLTITTTSLPNSFVGNSGYSATLSAQNGQAPYTWSVSGGALPGGLSLNGSTITGTPTTAGTFSFTIRAIDSTAPTSQVATQFFSVTIAPVLNLTSGGFPNGVVGVAYATTCTTSGGTPPYNFSISSGSLPAGLGLNTASCTINGTPSGNSGPFNFTIKVTDSGNPAQSANLASTITIYSGLAITSGSVPNGATGQPYSFTLAAQNGTPPYTWAVTTGALPTGLNLVNGTISGTPTAVGTYSFAIKVTDSGNPQQSATQNFSNVSVVSGLTITSNSTLGAATQSTAYTATLTAANGTGTLTWALGNGSSLPAGLSLSSSGLISGTPTTPGTTTFTVKVTDSGTPQQTVSQTFTLTVNPFTAPVVPTFTFNLPSTSQTPGVSLSGTTVTASPTSSTAWPLTIALGFTPNAAGVASTYMDPALQFVDSTGKLLGTTYDITVPALTGSVSLPQIAPGTVAGQISLTLSVIGQTGATSFVTVPSSVPIITAGSVQILNVTSSGFDVEVVANSSPRDLKTATFSFSAASGTSISGTTSFSLDVSSVMTSWYGGTTSQQYGSEFSLTVPFTFSGSSAAISSVTVTLTNSVGASSPVTGTK